MKTAKKFTLQQWAYSLEMKPAPKAVLLCLIWHYNVKTERCNPAQATIAQETGFSISSVRRAMKELEDKKIIKRTLGKMTYQCSFSVCRSQWTSEPVTVNECGDFEECVDDQDRAIERLKKLGEKW